jgi:YHS domain-containing protein
MSPDIISRKSARAAGQTFYFTGQPCKRGHVAKRYSHNANCVVCVRLIGAQWKKTAKGRKYYNEWQNRRRAQQRAERAAKIQAERP